MCNVASDCIDLYYHLLLSKIPQFGRTYFYWLSQSFYWVLILRGRNQYQRLVRIPVIYFLTREASTYLGTSKVLDQEIIGSNKVWEVAEDTTSVGHVKFYSSIQWMDKSLG